MRTGEWLSIAILGLVILFVVISLSFFRFLIDPDMTGPTRTVEPASAFIQIIFISVAPAIALSIFLNALSDGSKLSYILIVVSGVCLIFGMLYVSILIPLITQLVARVVKIYACDI